MLPPLLPCCSLGNPGWQLLNQPFLFYILFAFHPCLPRFPRGVYSYLTVSCVFFVSLPPSPILFPFPLSSSPFPSPLQSSLLSPFPSPLPSCVRLRVPTPVPVPVPVPAPPRPRSRPRSRPALLHSLPPPFPLPLRPRPLDRPRPRYRLRSPPRLQSRPRPRSLLPAPRIRLPPRYDALVPTLGPTNGAVGCSQAPPPVCRDGDACGMRVPAVKQKENRRRRRATSEGRRSPNDRPCLDSSYIDLTHVGFFVKVTSLPYALFPLQNEKHHFDRLRFRASFNHLHMECHMYIFAVRLCLKQRTEQHGGFKDDTMFIQRSRYKCARVLGPMPPTKYPLRVCSTFYLLNKSAYLSHKKL